LYGTKFTAKCVKIELPDYERSHKPRSNTFDEFCKDFDYKVDISSTNEVKETMNMPRKISMNIQTKEQEEAKNTIEQEGAAWATELKLGDVIGCQAQDEDGFQEVKPKTKKKIHSNKYEEDDRRGVRGSRSRGRGYRGRGDRGRGRGDRGRGDRGRGDRGRGDRGRGDRGRGDRGRGERGRGDRGRGDRGRSSRGRDDRSKYE